MMSEQSCGAKGIIRPELSDEDQYPNGNPHGALNPAAARNTDSVVSLAGAAVVHDYACDGPAAGAIALRWAYGSVCAARNTDPDIQIIRYNDDTILLRQNVCVDWRAPFTYLLFGNAGALLIDSGATEEAEFYPLRRTVDALIENWCAARRVKDIPLTVALCSREYAAQNQGIKQFAGRANTVLAPDYHSGKIDLGGRVITVLSTPGAHRDGVSFYDPYCDFLFTGDLFFPGRVAIANDRDYVASMERLVDFACAHPVKWVMGAHIDMMFAPGHAYPRFASYKPYERLLQMDAALLADALEHARGLQGKAGVVMRADYHLLNRVSPDEMIYSSPKDLPEVPIAYWLPL